MAIRREPIRDSMMFYELMDESESINELNATIEGLVNAFRSGIMDLCSDNGWDIDELDTEII